MRCLDISRGLMILDHFRLDGKNALVTGSHRGLGAAIAIALAEAGANVACHGRSPEPGEAPERIRGLGRKSAYFAGDVADVGVCVSLIEKTVGEFGSIDILVNNAGIIRRAPAAEYSAANWDEVIATNMTSVFHLSQVAGRQMLNQGRGGKIVSIASVLSFQGGIYVPAYAAAKGGLAQLPAAPVPVHGSHPGRAMGRSAGVGRSRCFSLLSRQQLRAWACSAGGWWLAGPLSTN